MRLCKFFLFAMLLLSAVEMAGQWRSVDDSALSVDERMRRSDYQVWISRGGGEFEALEVRGALVSNMDRRSENSVNVDGATRTLMGFVMFTDSFDRPVKVRVRRQGEPFESVEVRPSAYKISPKRVDGQTIEFTLKEPSQKVSVEFDGDRDHNLFVIADLLDVNKPAVGPAGEGTSGEGNDLIYFGPGEHEAGEIVLKSGQRLYLDEGAVVYGRVVASDAHDIAVLGRGILCGSRNVHDFNTRKILAEFIRCTDVTIDGIMMRASPSWTVTAICCKGFTINNMKHICWMRNSDGIDICGTSDVIIRNCFMRNYDDNISLKVLSWARANVENVVVEDCVFWADCAHNLLVGPESQEGFEMRNIRFSRCTLLEGRETADPWRGTIAIMVSDEGSFKDVTFEDITIDKVRGGMPFSVDFCKYETRGRKAKDIIIRNISYTGEQPTPQSVIRGLDPQHRVENVLIKNVKINGTTITRRNFSELVVTNDFVSGLEIR